MEPFIYSIFFSFVISLISLVGIIFFITHIKVNQITIALVSFAIGSLLGDAFIHLLPESFSVLPSPWASVLAISGIFLFFSIEKILRWHHCHDPDCEAQDDSSHIVSLNLIGDSVHNFIDGMLIAASFIVDLRLGLATVAAVILHEIPQEIGDIGIFLHHGVAIKQALKLNLFSALSSAAGVVVTFLLGTAIGNFASYLLPVTAGGFIYLAATDLIPELHRHNTSRNYLSQISLLILGVLLMYLLLFLE